MWTEFKAFLLKTNALALAIAVIIGAAAGAVVTSLVNDIIMPPIGYALGGVDFSQLRTVLRAAEAGDPATEVAIRWGSFLNALIAFVVIAFVVFLIARNLIREEPGEPDPEMQTCPTCRELVLSGATRCKFCTSEIPVTGAAVPTA
jgi:large conductance mechanosensitive channel